MEFDHLLVTAPTPAIAKVYLECLDELKMTSCAKSLAKTTLWCVPDPIGVRIGSGGGTLNALDHLDQSIGRAALLSSRTLIIHSGGDSRRSPLHSVCGKAWASLNCAGHVSSPMALLVQELSRFCRALPEGAVVVASSDVLLDLSSSAVAPPAIPPDAITVVGVPEKPEVAKNHGVLVPDPSCLSGVAKDYLQKPSLAIMREKGAEVNGKVFIDTGIVVATGTAYAAVASLLDDPAVFRCTARGMASAPSPSPSPLRLELYSDMLYACRLLAGTCSQAEYYARIGGSPSAAFDSLWCTLSPVPLHLLPVETGSFFHLGTSAETLDMLCCVDSDRHQRQEQETKLVLFARKLCLSARVNSFVCSDADTRGLRGGAGLHPDESLVAMNSLVMTTKGPGQPQSPHPPLCSLVEHSVLRGSFSLGQRCVLSGLTPAVGLNLGLVPDGCMLQLVPLACPAGAATQSAVLVLLGIDDNVKLSSSDDAATMCGALWADLMAVSGVTSEELWNAALPASERTLWTAKLFCVFQLNAAGAEVAIDNATNVAIKWPLHLCAARAAAGPLASAAELIPLIRAKIDPEGTGEAMYKAAEKGDVAALLKIFDDMWFARQVLNDYSSPLGKWTPLLKASEKGHIECVRVLAAQPGIELNKGHRDTQSTALLIASFNGQIEVVEFLCSLPGIEGSISKANTGGNTPHRVACFWYLGPDKEERRRRVREILEAKVKASQSSASASVRSSANAAMLEALQHWRASERLSLSDVLSRGDASAMLGWRRLLRVALRRDDGGGSGHGGDAAAGAAAASHEGGQGGQGDGYGMLSLLRGSEKDTPPVTLLSLPRLLGSTWAALRQALNTITSAQLFASAPAPAKATSEALLALWCVHLCRGAPTGPQPTPSPAINNLLASVPRLAPQFHPRALFLAAFLAAMGHPRWLLPVDVFSGPRDTSVVEAEAEAVAAAVAVDGAEGLEGNTSISALGKKAALAALGLLVAAAGAGTGTGTGTGAGAVACRWQSVQQALESSAQSLVAAQIRASLSAAAAKAPASASASAPAPAPAPAAESSLSPTAATVTTHANANDNANTPNDVCLCSAPVRIDLSGGWSDTPPICYEGGGAVLNVAVRVDGKFPTHCAARSLSEPILRLRALRRSEGLEVKEERIECRCSEDLSDARPEGPCALLKAAAIVLGLCPWLPAGAAGGGGRGLEVACLSDLPAGSGMGGSSILAAAVVQCMSTAGLGVALSPQALVYTVLQVEQTMTTGGGWQDQVGAIYGGFKICRSPAGLPLTLAVEQCAVGPGVSERFSRRCFLVWTGQQRLARSVLINALRRGALTPCPGAGAGAGAGVEGERTNRDDSTVARLVRGAEKGFAALHHGSGPNPGPVSASTATPGTGCQQDQEQGQDKDQGVFEADLAVDGLCSALNEYRALKSDMAAGTEPAWLHAVLEGVLKPQCSGLALCGAGGGGYAVCVLRRGLALSRAQTGESERAAGFRILREALDAVGHTAMSVHTVDVDEGGLELRWLAARGLGRESERESENSNVDVDLALVLARAAGLQN